MPKPNAWLVQKQAEAALRLRKHRLFTIQQSKDMMLIAANEAFGFGPERLRKLSDAFDAAFMEYAETTLRDVQDDKELWFTKDKIDERLRKICGEFFVPWEVRYGA